MEIKSQDGHSSISLAVQESLPNHLPSAGDLALAIKAKHTGFMGENECVWFEQGEIERFLNELDKLEKKRSGEAMLASIGEQSNFCAFRFCLFATNAAGHLAAHVDLRKIQYLRNYSIYPAKIGFGFELEPNDLPKLMTDFAYLFRGAR